MKRLKTIVLLALAIPLGMFAKVHKTLYVVMDGIPADCIERLQPPVIMDIAKTGHYSRGYCGGKVGEYSQTATISAVGYTNLLTGTWMNKHHVLGNSDQKPDYNYHTLFRIAKEQQRPVTTALFSSWSDNRKVLIGENRADNGNFKIDDVYDGYDLDKKAFPEDTLQQHIFRIDSMVCHQAAGCVRQNAPDLSWVYLWYTDDAFHLFGNGTYTDRYVMKTDQLLAPVWEAVKYREKNFDEQWLLVIVTDHGRTEDGHKHGGQSNRERTVWFATNQKDVNAEFQPSSLAHVDLLPTICRFMNFDVPRDDAFEQDGLPFIGVRDIYDLHIMPYDDTVTLTWKSDMPKEKAKIYIASTNNFKDGKPDTWIELDSVASGKGKYTINLQTQPKSKFYKFVVATKNNHLNGWLNR